MVCIGFINNVGFGVMIAFLTQLSNKFDRNLQCAQFIVAVQAMPILARMFNANYLIQTPHDLRLFYVSLCQIIAYCILYAAVMFPTESVGIPCASFAALIFQASRAIGEATVVGYIKAIPQELVPMFGTGTGLGDGFQTITTLAILHYGIGAMNYALCLVFLVLPYFFFFTYFEHARLSHRQHKNVFKIEMNADDAIDMALKGHMSNLDKGSIGQQTNYDES